MNAGSTRAERGKEMNDHGSKGPPGGTRIPGLMFRNAYVFGIVGILSLVAFLMTVLFVPNQLIRADISNIVSIVVDVLAICSLLLAYKNTGSAAKRTKIAWGVFAGALLLYTGGDVTWFLLESVLRIQPFPSIADGFYLAFYLAFLVGIFFLLEQPNTKEEFIKRAIDIVIVSISALIGFWRFLIEPLMTSSGQSGLTQAISLAYPVGDMVLLFALLLLIYNSSEERSRWPVVCLTGGMLITIIADAIYSYESLQGLYASGSFLDLTWLVSTLLFGLAGVFQQYTSRSAIQENEYTDNKRLAERLQVFRTYYPYISLAIVVVILIIPVAGPESPLFRSLPIVLGVIGIIAAVLIRQWIALSENKRLNEQLRISLDKNQTQSADLERANRDLLLDIRQRKTAEEALRESQAQLSEALRIARMAYWEYDVAKDQFTFNDQFYSLFRTNAEAEGGYIMSSSRYAERFVHPEDIPLVGMEIQKALEAADPDYKAQVDHRILRTDGTVGAISVNIRIEKDEHGHTIRTHGVNQDISERKALEQQKEAMVGRLRADMEIADELIAAADLDTLYRRAVELAREKLHLDRCALFVTTAGGDVFGTYGTDRYGRTTDEHAQVWNKDKQWMERFSLPPAEAPRWIVNEASRLEWDGEKTVEVGRGWVAVTPLWAKKEPIGYFVNDAEITRAPFDPALQENVSIFCSLLANILERKQAEIQLRQREQLFRALFELSPDAVVLVDPSDLEGIWPIVDCNAVACSMNGHTREELIGQSIDILNAEPESKEERKDYIDKVRQAGILKLEVAHRHKNGNIYPVEVSTRVIRVGDQELLIGIDRDITARKQAEEKLADQAKQLQRNNEELRRLYRASGSLISESLLKPQEIAGNIVTTVLQEFGQSNCSLFVVSPDSKNLIRLAVEGPYSEQVKNNNLLVDGPGLVPTVIRSGEVVNVGLVQADPRYVESWTKARSELAIPLKIGNNVIGAIDVQSPEPNAFSPDDVRLLTIFAERAALGLEHGRLNLQTETHIQQLTALRTIDMAISSSFDIRLTLGVLLDQVINQLGVHAADVVIFDGATRNFKLVSQRGFKTGASLLAQPLQAAGYAWQVVRERKPINVVTPHEEDEQVRQGETTAEKFAFYMGVPLIAKGQVKGVLELHQRTPLQPDPEWTTFLGMLAGQAAIAIDNADLFEHLQVSNSELMLAYDSTLEGWAKALDLRDHDTAGHTRRTAEMTFQLARVLGIPDSELIHVSRGALLHDIGKMAVPDSIILKPGPLTDEEWEIMRKHPQFAIDLLSPIAYLSQALDIPFCHHEKWDGSGYPRGLQGEEIPLPARIFAIVDVWDALTSDRPYRKAWPRGKALGFIQEQSGKHFDPRVVDAFMKNIDNL